MSRSYRKTPIFGHCGTRHISEKKDKRAANQKLRSKNKIKINKGDEDFLLIDDVSNIWSMKKDGKSYWNPKKMKNIKKEMSK